MTAIADDSQVVLCPDPDCDFSSYLLADMDEHMRTTHTEGADR